MKKLYLVALGPTINRDVAINRLAQLPGYGPWFYSLPSTFCIYSNARAVDIFNVLHNPFDTNENLLITEVPSNCAGWLPQAHCNLIAQNSEVHSYFLNFKGYWVDGRQSLLPDTSGIYCVYSCKVLPDSQLSVSRLLYIGKANNIRSRHLNHERLDAWKQCLSINETLCFSCAELPIKSLSVCEAAMIYKHQPPCNEQCKDGFYHSTTHVGTSGANLYLVPDFIVYKTC